MQRIVKLTNQEDNMNYFGIYCDKAEKQLEVFENVAKKIKNCAHKIDNINSELDGIGLSAASDAVEHLLDELKEEENESSLLLDILKKIIELYRRLEEIIANNDLGADASTEINNNTNNNSNNNTNNYSADHSTGLSNTTGYHGDVLDGNYDINPYLLDSELFDENYAYGANQDVRNSPYREQLYDIACENLPEYDLTVAQFNLMLNRLNSEGCFYAAMTNSILMKYENDPEGFEEVFGYPLYADGNNKEFNYDLLLVDLYTSTDMEYGGWDYNEEEDVQFNLQDDNAIHNPYNVMMDPTGNGINVTEAEACLNAFMSEHGQSMVFESDVAVTPENYQSICEEGKTVIIEYYDGVMYDEYGKPENVEAHAMVVTGVTEDGKFIVSSWGQRFYIDPTQSTDENGNPIDTGMLFDTVYYE